MCRVFLVILADLMCFILLVNQTLRRIHSGVLGNPILYILKTNLILFIKHAIYVTKNTE